MEMFRGSPSRRAWRGGVAALAAFLFVLVGFADVQGSSVAIEARSQPYVFAPAAKTIHVGDTTGTGQFPDGKFDSGPGLIQPGASYSHTFTTAGTYPYFCKIHADSGMTGTITVVAVAATPPPTPRPTPGPGPTPRPTASRTPAPTVAPTAPPSAAPTPSASPSASQPSTQSPGPIAAASPVSSGDLQQSPGPTTTSGAIDSRPSSDSTPLAAASVLIAIAILVALGLLARRSRNRDRPT
ncbi:MAG: hypothetical protein NVS9B8_15440 [Candidatus Limnocylindrales bacterium]